MLARRAPRPTPSAPSSWRRVSGRPVSSSSTRRDTSCTALQLANGAMRGASWYAMSSWCRDRS